MTIISADIAVMAVSRFQADIHIHVATSKLTGSWFSCQLGRIPLVPAELSSRGRELAALPSWLSEHPTDIPSLLKPVALEEFSKPLSLSFRLFGNILADELTLSVL